jgi:4-hydroxy-tetrahydrodipicolinate synthase
MTFSPTPPALTSRHANPTPASERCAWRGVFTALATPFQEDGRVDRASLEALVDFEIESGADGIVVHAPPGETEKLGDGERRSVTESVLKRAHGRLPVLVGVSAGSNYLAVELARHAKDHGAQGLLAAPPPGAAIAESQVRIFYDELDAAVELPVLLHDAVQRSAVPLSPHLLAEIHQETAAVVGALVESAPTATKMGALTRLAPTLACFGGLEGAFLLEELERGARGVVCGPAVPGDYVQILSAFRAQDVEGARRGHARIAELVRFLSQSAEFSYHATKHLLTHRGVFDRNTVRRPTSPFDEGNVRSLLRIAMDVGVIPRVPAQR